MPVSDEKRKHFERKGSGRKGKTQKKRERKLKSVPPGMGGPPKRITPKS